MCAGDQAHASALHACKASTVPDEPCPHSGAGLNCSMQVLYPAGLVGVSWEKQGQLLRFDGTALAGEDMSSVLRNALKMLNVFNS